MTILDSFFILFESDASKLDKGLTESEKKAKELTDHLGGVDKAAGKMGKSLLKSLTALGGTLLATLSVAALTRSFFAASDAADALGKATASFGGNIGEVSAWGDAAKLAGGSAEAFQGSLTALSQSLAEISVQGTGGAAPYLKELGIDMESAAYKGKSALEIFPHIAESFEKMSRTKSLGIGRKLGLDIGTIMLLQSGRRAVEEQIAKQKELGVVTEHQAQVSADFNDSLDDTAHAFRSLWLSVAEYVLPALTAINKGIAQLGVFMRKHSDFIIGLLIAIGSAIAIFVLPPLVSMAAATIVAFAPFILAAALVTALGLAFALLYDDIMNFIDGGDSMIGRIVNKWPIIGEILRIIGAEFKYLWEIAKAIRNFLVGMFTDPAAAFEKFKTDILAGANAFIDSVPGMREAIGDITGAFIAAGDTIGAVWDAVVAAVKSAIGVVTDSVDAVVGAYNKAKSFIGLGDEEGEGAGSEQGNTDSIASAARQVRQDVARGQEQMRAASTTALASQTSNSINNTRGGDRTTQVTVGKIEVKTQATDAEGISKAIGGTMQTQMRQAVNNFDDGVLA